ncbi:MAG TPA: aroma-sacti cluster domain-containing protein [Holophagaceae bacterium]|jgi:hypothetical protein|nr:aroma-sacti cluster domain-containing protein [Holophagaceae bacterium]
MSNVETLVNAGVIKDAKDISPEMAKKINALSPEEVTHLVSVKSKLGEDDLKAHAKVMMM